MMKLPIYQQPDTLELGEARQRDSECRSCKLGGIGPYTCMPSFAKNPEEAKVLFVFGEGHEGAARPAPLDAKIQQRYMGTGARSHVIPKLMKQFGFSQWDAAYAHAVRCSTEGFKFNKDFGLDDAVGACRPYMADTISKLPNLERIICIGPVAQKSILGRSINQNALNPYSWYRQGDRDIAVFSLKWPVTNEENKFKHAAYARSLAFALQSDLSSLNQAPWGKEMFVVQTPEDARQACEDLRRGKFVAFDTEWSGIMFDNTDFTVLSLSATRPGLEGAYLWYGKYLYQDEVRGPIDELLSDPTVPISGQNVKADIHCMKHGFGVEVTNIYGDTQLQRKLYETDRDGADLDTLAESVGMGGHKKDMKEAVGVAVKIIKVARKKAEGRKLNAPERAILEDNEKFYKSNYCKVAVENPHVEPEAFAYGMTSKLLLNRYNCKDTIATALVQEHLDQAIDYVTITDFDGNKNWKPLRYVWDTLISKAIPAVAHMEQNGICVDRGTIDLVRFKADEKIAELEKRLQAVADINWGSSVQRQEVFYKKLKLPPPPRQVESNPKSTSKKVVNWWLKNNHNPHGIVQAYADYNDIKTLRSNYTDKLESYIRGDGRVHPSFKLDGTVSGRMSCVEPNLQQIPRAQSDIAKMVKNCFQSSPGYTLIQLDYSQLELRIASMMSEDPGMIDIYVRGEDYHTGTAKAIAGVMWGISPDEVEKKHRSAAKTLNFAMLYGMGDDTLAFALGVAVGVAKKLRSSVMGAFSKLDKWFKAQLRTAETTGYCWTWWDGHRARRRNLYNIDSKNGAEKSKAKNGSGNTPIQGTASDFNMASIPVCDQWLKDHPQYRARMVLTVHDSLIFEAPDEHVQVVASNMQRIMQSWNAKNVPIKVDCEVGKAWGSLKEYDTKEGKVKE